jgi:hypothetical protein
MEHLSLLLRKYDVLLSHGFRRWGRRWKGARGGRRGLAHGSRGGNRGFRGDDHAHLNCPPVALEDRRHLGSWRRLGGETCKCGGIRVSELRLAKAEQDVPGPDPGTLTRSIGVHPDDKQPRKPIHRIGPRLALDAHPSRPSSTGRRGSLVPRARGGEQHPTEHHDHQPPAGHSARPLLSLDVVRLFIRSLRNDNILVSGADR